MIILKPGVPSAVCKWLSGRGAAGWCRNWRRCRSGFRAKSRRNLQHEGPSRRRPEVRGGAPRAARQPLSKRTGVTALSGRTVGYRPAAAGARPQSPPQRRRPRCGNAGAPRRLASAPRLASVPRPAVAMAPAHGLLGPSGAERPEPAALRAR